ncbi:sterol desaturase family protein [Sessilibacter sp. MAH4]
MLESLKIGLLSPFQSIADSGSRVFWLFLLANVVIAVVFLALRFRQFQKEPIANQEFSFGRYFVGFFSAAHWRTKSSLVDVSYWLANSVIKYTALMPVVFSYATGTLWVDDHLRAWFVSPGWQIAPGFLALLYTLIFFIIDDLSRFLLHRALHLSPMLWRFHKVHHSATNLTPITLYRVHPVEMMLYFFRALLVYVVITGVFLFLFSGKLTGVTLLGSNACIVIFNLLGANLRHSHIPLGFGFFEKWFISPLQHQVHHSSEPEHFDKNFGSVLAIWDRFFNSWYSSQNISKTKALSFGLDENSPLLTVESDFISSPQANDFPLQNAYKSE